MSKRLHRRTLYLTPKHYTADQVGALVRACAALNEAFARPLFAIRLSPPSRHTVHFSDESIRRVGYGDEVTAFVEKRSQYWVMGVRPYLTHEHLMVTLLHELGHILGLGHAKDPVSVMCATPEPCANAFDWVAHAREIAHRAGVLTAGQRRGQRAKSVPVRQQKRVLSHPLAHLLSQAKAV